MQDDVDYYRILDVHSSASQEEIRRSYLTLMKMLHPDRFDPIKEAAEYRKATELTQQVIEAYRVLGDPACRRQYDAARNPQQPMGINPTPPNSAPPKPKPPSPPNGRSRRYIGNAFAWILLLLLVGPIAYGFLAALYKMVRDSIVGVTNTSIQIPRIKTQLEQQQELQAKKTQEINRFILQDSDFYSNKTPNEVFQQSDKLLQKLKNIPPVNAQPFPRHGTTLFFGDAERIAGLKLSTPPGSFYYIKLVDIETGKKMGIIYLHGGKAFNTKVPLGKFFIYCGTGTSWYGNKIKFGPGMTVSKFDTPFDFFIRGDYVVGKEIDFQKVINGNLSSMSARPEDLD